jgi:hypothetical protein
MEALRNKGTHTAYEEPYPTTHHRADDDDVDLLEQLTTITKDDMIASLMR